MNEKAEKESRRVPTWAWALGIAVVILGLAWAFRPSTQEPAPAPAISSRIEALASLKWERGEAPPPDAAATVVAFVATWCPKCVAAAPELESLARAFGPRGARVCAVSLDKPEVLRAWLSDHPSTNTFALAFGTPQANQVFNGAEGAKELPVAFLLGPGGEHLGRMDDLALLPPALDLLLPPAP